MSIIPQKANNIKPYELAFMLHNANGNEFLDYDLPFPNYLYHTHQGHIVIMWFISGFFGTAKNREYLNDIIARFLISFKEHKPNKIDYTLDRSKEAHKSDLIHELKAFQTLKSIRPKIKAPERADMFADNTFWAIKLFAEDLIRDNGFCQYERMLEFALSNFEHKEKSTLRAKCRSVFNYYAERDFQLPREKKYNTIEEWYEESKMTRQENMIKINIEKGEEARRKVLSITSGMFAEEYKRAGKWNVSKIAKDLKMSRNTVAKYIIEA